MNMRSSKGDSFANLSILSHRDFPLTEKFQSKGKIPFESDRKVSVKVYILKVKDSPSMYVTEKESAVAPLLILFTVTIGPLTAFLSKEMKEMTDL